MPLIPSAASPSAHLSWGGTWVVRLYVSSEKVVDSFLLIILSDYFRP